MSPSSTVAWRFYLVWSTSKWKPSQARRAWGRIGSASLRHVASSTAYERSMRCTLWNATTASAVRVVPAVPGPDEPVVRSTSRPRAASRSDPTNPTTDAGAGRHRRGSSRHPLDVGCRERCLRAVGAGLRDREPRTEPTGRTHRHPARIDVRPSFVGSTTTAEPGRAGPTVPRTTTPVEQPDQSHPSRDDGADPDGHRSAHALREHGNIAVGARRLGKRPRNRLPRPGGCRGDR